MSYTRGMGDTASDIARVAAAAASAAASIIGAAAGTTPGTAATTIDPATGLPYGTIDPATGLPYGTPAMAPETDYTAPIVIGGLVLVGIGGYFLMRKRSTPNRRRRSIRRNGPIRYRGYELEDKCVKSEVGIYDSNGRHIKTVDTFSAARKWLDDNW